MVPSHFHDVTHDKIKFDKKYCRTTLEPRLNHLNSRNSYLGRRTNPVNQLNFSRTCEISGDF